MGYVTYNALKLFGFGLLTGITVTVIGYLVYSEMKRAVRSEARDIARD